MSALSYWLCYLSHPFLEVNYQNFQGKKFLFSNNYNSTYNYKSNCEQQRLLQFFALLKVHKYRFKNLPICLCPNKNTLKISIVYPKSSAVCKFAHEVCRFLKK